LTVTFEMSNISKKRPRKIPRERQEPVESGHECKDRSVFSKKSYRGFIEEKKNASRRNKRILRHTQNLKNVSYTDEFFFFKQ